MWSSSHTLGVPSVVRSPICVVNCSVCVPRCSGAVRQCLGDQHVRLWLWLRRDERSRLPRNQFRPTAPQGTSGRGSRRRSIGARTSVPAISPGPSCGPMRVLHITNAGGGGRVQLGGAERAVAELTAYFATKLGWEVGVVAPEEFLHHGTLINRVQAFPEAFGVGALRRLARITRRLQASRGHYTSAPGNTPRAAGPRGVSRVREGQAICTTLWSRLRRRLFQDRRICRVPARLLGGHTFVLARDGRDFHIERGRPGSPANGYRRSKTQLHRELGGRQLFRT